MHRDETVQKAAKLMRAHHVGDVIVVDIRNGMQVPVGIVTDRVLWWKLWRPNSTRSLLQLVILWRRNYFTVTESTGVFESIQYMRRKTVRRLPIINDQGGLVGILTLDDVLELLSDELLELSKLIKYEQKKEIRYRP